MALSPQEVDSCIPETISTSEDGEKIVISGMAGLYPNCHNIKELSDILYTKTNPITADGLRYQFHHPEVAQYGGKVPMLNRFDAQFFKVHFRQAACMDPMSRKVLEQAYHAIYDAGVNPEQLSGRKVGVFIGSCVSEYEKTTFYNNKIAGGFGITGCSRTMYANRISYWLNTRGPSVALDESCCSAIAALEQAYIAMSRGDCEAAVVGATFLCLYPQYAVHLNRIVGICPDGKTKSYDQNADGCTKSEAINVLFLQKAKDALRIYAELLHVKTQFVGIPEDKIGPRYGFYRDPFLTSSYLKSFYDEAKIPPQVVEYVEGFGCAIGKVDKAELEAFDEVFCDQRDQPLLIGSVMSNIGYGEAATGISAITKVLLGYHNGELAANLHCNEPRSDVAALREGRMHIVTDHQRFGRSYVAVNGVSVTGINSHVLLHGHYKPKDPTRYKSSIPYLVTVTGRMDTAVNIILEDLKSRPIDPEELALLHNIHKMNTQGHLGRGFIILDTDEAGSTKSIAEKAGHFDIARRPLWFVYSGMGSQWAGMGAQLMRIPIFAAAIERCHRALEPKGINLTHIITSDDDTIFDNILHSFVGIAAVQIGLTDILRELDLVPDGIIGHSVGELGCAYADGCLTAEEMILSAYSRGLVSLLTPLISGSMAAVGLGYEQISKMCPSDIEVACHNGPASSTISGPADAMREFVGQLTKEGVFAKEVPCSNIAYHSRYIANAGPGLLKYLSEVIESPKPRSSKWVSTSVPMHKWDDPVAEYCSPEYLTNNLLSPVLFEETSRVVPSNAVLVEVAPHGLLQAILKRSMPPDCVNIALTRRKHPDNAICLLEAIGKLHMEGYTPKVQVLYPTVEFPVSTGTPHLSHLVKWAHEEIWPLPVFSMAETRKSAILYNTVCLHDDENNYLRGNVVRGQILYPYAAVLTLVWDTLAMTMGVGKKLVSVQFHDVHLHAQPPLHDRRQLRLTVALHRGNGRFEVLDEDAKIATGVVVASVGKNSESSTVDAPTDGENLTAEDIYYSLHERGYSYRDEFRSIVSVNSSLTEALLQWQDNWVTLMDGMLQLNTLRQAHHTVSTPTFISHIRINVKKPTLYQLKVSDKIVIKAEILETLNMTRCGGVTMQNIKFHNLPPKNDFKMELRSLKFVPDVNYTENGILKGEQDYTTETQKGLNNVTLQCQKIGDLNSLTWAKPVDSVESGNTVLVHFAGINRSDVKKATGALSFDSDSGFGMDYSGTTESGERVMGIVHDGSCSSRVRSVPELLWPVPAHWSLEEAVTVPLAYANAFYCFAIKGRLDFGMNVLIHGGAGALGQAAISIALAYDCQVFTTVKDIRKRQFLKKLFPDLKDDHILNSRDQSFADYILGATKGKGCNIIISTVKEDLKHITSNCVAFLGTVIDVTQLIDQDEFSFGMFNLTRARSYKICDFSSIFDDVTKRDMKKLQLMISDGIVRGYVRPLSRVIYEPHQAARAFHLVAASAHRGRVLLSMRDLREPAQPRINCNSESCHLVLCDDENLGVQLVDKLVNRGARKVYLHYRYQEAGLQAKLRSWQKLGIRVEVSSSKLNTEMDLIALLQQCTHLGSVESINVVLNKNLGNIPESAISQLDLLSRKLCPNVKLFAVTNVGGSVGQNTCLSRKQNKYPATMLTLSNPEVSWCDDVSWYRCAVDTWERAVLNGCPVQIAHTLQESQSKTLLQHLFSLVGISVPDDIGNNPTLEQLGISGEKLELISSFLRNNYNISYTTDQIPLLTIQRIKDIEKNIKEFPFEQSMGLAMFYKYVDPDELSGTAEAVYLPTLVNSSMMRDNENDPNEPCLCIIPGLEGLHIRFRVLCERLKLPALVLQPGLDNPHETPRELAERYVEVMIRKFGLQDNFYLLGYESGVLVALEVAAILEDKGLTGTVFCVGCTPEELQTILEDQLRHLDTDEKLQNEVVLHMFTLQSGGDTGRLKEKLENTNTWTQKLNACVQFLSGRLAHSAQYTRALIEAALARIQQARRNRVTTRSLRSKLVLLRSTTMFAGEGPGALQQFSKQTVPVHQLRAPLGDAAVDLSFASIVNRYLDQEIINKFENINRCDSYLLNGDCFSMELSATD